MIKVEDEYTADIKAVAQRIAALIQFKVDTVDIQKLPTELSLEPVRSDAVYFLPQFGQILHLEFQTEPQSKPPVPLRMLDYWVRLYTDSIVAPLSR